MTVLQVFHPPPLFFSVILEHSAWPCRGAKLWSAPLGVGRGQSIVLLVYGRQYKYGAADVTAMAWQMVEMYGAEGNTKRNPNRNWALLSMAQIRAFVIKCSSKSIASQAGRQSMCGREKRQRMALGSKLQPSTMPCPIKASPSGTSSFKEASPKRRMQHFSEV